MSKPIVVAQAGYGYWGPNLLRVFSELEDCRVKWLCELKPGRLEAARRKLPGLNGTADFEDILRDPEVDAVVVATEVVTHFPLVRAALNAGKHVFVEKPLAHSSNEAKALSALAARKKLTLGVGHVFLYHPAVRALKAELTPGRLGALRYVDMIRVNPGPPAPKHDVVWDMAPHDVALALYLAQAKPLAVRATGRRYANPKLDEMASFEIDFPKGVLARIHVSWMSSRRVRRVEAYAAHGSAFYDDVEPFEKLRVVSAGEDTRVGAGARETKALYYAAGDIRIPALPPEEPLKTECRDFLDAVRRGRQPLSGPSTGVDVVRILEAAARSAAAQGRAVRLS